MAANFFQLLLTSWKRFNDDRCFTAAIVISYFSLLCLVPLIALFAFLGAKILGNLYVFAGPDHDKQAQKPKKIDLNALK